MKKLSLILLFPFLLFAQSESYQFGGYAKYLYSNADNPAFGRVDDHIIHSRLNSKFFFSEEITATAELRNRVFFGGSVEKTPNFLSTIQSDHDFGNADIVWWNTHSSVAHSELDRFYVDATYEKFQFTLGRQRVAWGTALAWNPTDLFNPLSILDFDYEERPGVDAIRGQYFMSEVSKVEIALKPGKTKSRSVIAGKILLNQWNYDFHILGGAHGENPFFGAEWAGDIAGAGFRGEAAIRRIGDETKILFPSLNATWSTSAVLSADYTFANNTYLHTEILFSDQGVTRNAAAFLPASLSLGLLSPARWSLFQELSFDVHPLVRLSGFIIYNLNDASSALVPSVSWSALENFDVTLFGLIFSGDALTEYGGYGQTVFIRAKYSF
ncbi:MAG: hypothetical protein HYV29_03375 [Ignavibacteriales bacterium]|nr:hypothetical protein [Ignavibacteriales bacterium]